MAADGLVLRGIEKRWPGAAKPTLDGVDLEVALGELELVAGENGAGKTTLLRIVAGMLDPDSGDVLIGGRPAQEDRVGYQRELGVVTAGNSGLYNRLNCLQHLQLAARLSFVERSRRASSVRAMFDTFGLLDFGGQRVDRLSMGQRQRLRLAMAFVHEPTVLLLDEPETSLDVAGSKLLASALQDHLRSGRCAVWLAPTGAAPPVPTRRSWILASGRLSQA